jgi:hypothetical protein
MPPAPAPDVPARHARFARVPPQTCSRALRARAPQHAFAPRRTTCGSGRQALTQRPLPQRAHEQRCRGVSCRPTPGRVDPAPCECDVDRVRAQPLQAVLDRAQRAVMAVVVSHLEGHSGAARFKQPADLGGEHHVRAGNLPPRRAARLSAGCQHGSSGQHDPQVKADRLAQPFHADTPSGSADSGWLPADIVMTAAFSDENSNAIDTAITATDRIGSTAAQMGTSKPQRQRPHPGDARTGSPWAETTPMHAHQGIAISRNNRCRATPDFSPVCRSGGLRG